MGLIRYSICCILLINALLHGRLNGVNGIATVAAAAAAASVNDSGNRISTGSSKNESTCGIEQFRCNNGRCIPNKWRCDSENDCSDASDEAPAMCMNFCIYNEFKCANGEQCIPRIWLCDGSPDCRDKSDEANCLINCINY